jgi:hypothetical protein
LCPKDYAYSPGSDILVWFLDLPKRTRAALYKRLEKEAAEARRSRDSGNTGEEDCEIVDLDSLLVEQRLDSSDIDEGECDQPG